MSQSLATYKRVEWPDKLGDKFARACGKGLNSIRAEVQTGAAFMLEFVAPNGGFGTAVIRREPEELVLVAASNDSNIPCISAFVEDMKIVCRDNGINKMRFHSFRKGAERFVSPMGFVLSEIRGDEKIFHMEL